MVGLQKGKTPGQEKAVAALCKRAGGKAARCKTAGTEVEAMSCVPGSHDVAVIADLPRQANALKYRPPGG